MRSTSSIWVLSALSTLTLGSALPKSCENNTDPAGTPILSFPDSSHVTPAPVLLPDSLAKPQPLDHAPISSSSVGRSPHLGSANLPRAANKAVDIAAILAGSSINLPLLSSILLSGIPEGATRTVTLNPTIILTLPRPYPTESATRVSSALATATTSAALLPSRSTTVLPTSKATSAEPSEISATESLVSLSSSPSMSQDPEPSTASAEGHTLGTSSTLSSARSTEIPPAPSAAGASGNMSARGKERVWWVIFFTPFLLMA